MATYAHHHLLPKFLQLLFRSLAPFSLVLPLVFDASAQQTNLVSNTYTPIVTTSFSGAVATSSNTIPVIGPTAFSPLANVTNPSLTDFATSGYLLVGGSCWLQVVDNLATGANRYPAGSYAGFVISTAELLSTASSTNITVSTYLDGVATGDSYTSSISSLVKIAGANQSKVGLISTTEYNGIRVTFNISGVSLTGSVSVLYAEVAKFTAGPSLACNANTAMNVPAYPMSVNSSVSGAVSLLSGVSGLDAVISSSQADFATINPPTAGALGNSFSIGVKDNISNYSAPTFVGFDLEFSASLLGLNLGNDFLVLTAYKDGVAVEQTTNGTYLADATLLSGNNRRTIGFVPNTDVDEIRITIHSGALASASLGTIKIYGAVFRAFCAGPALSCNTNTSLNLPSYPMSVSSTVSGGISLLGGISNPDAIISNSTSDFATIDPAVGALGNSFTVSVKDNITDHVYPTFVGFDIESASLANLSLGDNFEIRAYSNGVLSGSATGNSLLVGASVLTGTNRQVVGFVPAGAVDSVCLVAKSGLIAGVSLGVINIYGAIFRSFCEGPELNCNTLTIQDQSQFPVYINAQRTGVTGGVLGVNNNIQDASNVIDNDPDSYATAAVLAGALNQVSLSVKKELSDFTAGTFAGFEIGHASTLLIVDLLDDITIVTYLNGVLVDSKNGNNALLSVSSSLLGGGANRQVVGFVTTGDYDEVVLSFRNTVAANTGVTRIYSFYEQKFCTGTINCNGTYWLNAAAPPAGYPVIINAQRTGTGGLACANVTGVELSNPQHVISASTTDYATIKMGVNALCPVSISVEDVRTTYPSGTIAGFAIRNMSSLIELDLFNSITLQTWNNGALQESVTGVGLLQLELLGSPIFGGGAGTYNVGITTSLPFDEIRISFGALVNVDPLPEVRVYGVFVDTRNVTSSDGSQSLTCLVPALSPASPAPVCAGNSVLLTAAPADAASYQWFKDDVEIPAAIDQTYAATESGYYTVIVNATGYSGAPSNAVVVTVNPTPAVATISAGGSTTFCHNGSVTLTSSVANGNQWYKDNVLIDNATGQSYIATAGGSYTVLITAAGCTSAVSNAIIVVVENCTPIAVDDIAGTGEDMVLNGDVTTNDTPSGDGGNTWSLVGANGGAAHGTVVMNGNGEYVYTPAPNYNGSDVFTYQLCDANNDCATAVVNININSINDAPVAGTATATAEGNPGGSTNVSVSAALFSGTDIDGSIQSLTIAVFPSNATSITINGITYTSVDFPAAGVVVPTNTTGQPTQTINIDPVAGTVDVIINYTVTDNELAVSDNTGSVTLPFMELPDLAPNITVAPNIMSGTTSFYLTVQVTELNSISTNGSITVIIPKDSRVSFSYNPSLTTIGFTTVNNNVWTYDGGNAFYHVFTSNSIIPANGWSVFGVQASFNPLNAKGAYTLTASINSGSGGENRTTNNNDAEVVNYFPGN